MVHVFPAGTVCHVHGVYSDPYAAGLWCTTGDRGSECRISMTTDQFQTLETVGGGDESWRCVSLQFTQEGIYYASDAEFQQNYIYRIDRQSGKRSVLTEIEGPVYYSHATGQDLFFGVSAELCPSQQGRSAVLWCVSDQQKCSRLLAFEKDRLSVKYFLTGAFYFPCGPGLADEFFFHGIALRGADNRTFRARKRASPDEADRDAQEA